MQGKKTLEFCDLLRLKYMEKCDGFLLVVINISIFTNFMNYFIAKNISNNFK